jgi:uncharacterized protein YkwD
MKKLALALLVLATSLPLFAADITRESVLAGMNERRAQAGLPPLQFDTRLNAAAEDRMRDMEELGYWGHQAPDGRSPFVWLKPHDYTFANAGENLAKGFETAELLTESWMESKGHRDNILSPLFTDCGIAIIEGATTGRATGKSIVVLFGRPRFDAPQQHAAR